MTSELWSYVAAGFLAQLVDGALGMAYGVTATSLLMSVGVSPAVASATVHAAECATTGASALAHRAHGNISRRLFRRLVIPGVIGAMAGAFVLTSAPVNFIKPAIAFYLMLLGLYIIAKAFVDVAPKEVTTCLAPLAFFGALFDAIGGGGWGPIVTSNLVARGNNVREAIGSVNAVEFFVTLASTSVFVLTLGVTNWPIVASLAAGGLVAAPLGARLVGRIARRPLMITVGALVVALSLRTLSRSLG